jgi:hypothetical protein
LIKRFGVVTKVNQLILGKAVALPITFPFQLSFGQHAYHGKQFTAYFVFFLMLLFFVI